MTSVFDDVEEISTIEQYDNLIDQSKDRLVVIKFSAYWCGPCKKIQPHYIQLSGEYKNVIFAHLDVDLEELKSLAILDNINSLPTFLFIKDEKKVSEVLGANITKIREKLNELLDNPTDNL